MSKKPSVDAALSNPDLTPIADQVSVPLGLGKAYLTRQALFDDRITLLS